MKLKRRHISILGTFLVVFFLFSYITLPASAIKSGQIESYTTQLFLNFIVSVGAGVFTAMVVRK